MLLQCEAPAVNGGHCEQAVQDQGKTPKRDPRHLVLRWRDSKAPSVQEFVGHDVTFAYIISEHMMGLREGDTVVLYALHWSHGWGHA